MEEQARHSSLGEWLKERCQKERLSLREAGNKTGLSHSTIQTILSGGVASPQTVRKLVVAFGGDGHQQRAVEDRLLILAGYRSERPEGELSELQSQLLDKLSGLSEPKLKMISQFADFLAELEEK